MKLACSESMVKSAVAEFLGCWAAGGKASLSLDTKGGSATLTFSCTLGNPGAPLYPPTSSHRKRNRGPKEKQRGRERAKRHQEKLAAIAAPSPASSSPLPSRPTSPTPASEGEEVLPSTRTCKRCGLPCKNHPAPGYGIGKCQVTLAASASAPSSPSPQEILRNTTASMVGLVSSPIKEIRTESCYNCGEQSTPTHQCYEDSTVASSPPSSPTTTSTPFTSPFPRPWSPSNKYLGISPLNRQLSLNTRGLFPRTNQTKVAYLGRLDILEPTPHTYRIRDFYKEAEVTINDFPTSLRSFMECTVPDYKDADTRWWDWVETAELEYDDKICLTN